MNRIIIYTDGGCRGNPGIGGWGVWLRYGDHDKKLQGAQQDTTNNRMELTAAIKALEAIKSSDIAIDLFTDSKYVVDSVEKKWVLGWEKKGFSGKKNSDLWMRFLKIYRRHIVRFQWIKGHNNHMQNERCDFLAVEASKKEKVRIDTFYESQNNLQ